MFKFVIIIGIAINAINCELSIAESTVDTIFAHLFRLGDPDQLWDEDPSKFKKACDKIESNFMQDQTDNLAKLYKGIAQKNVQASMNSFSAGAFNLCNQLKQGQSDSVSKALMEVNKHVTEASKLRLSLMTVVEEATHKDTKTTLPELACYTKQFKEKFIGVYPETDGAQAVIKNLMDITLTNSVRLMTEKAEASDSCQLPEAKSNPSEFKSFIIQLLKAMDNLDKS